MIRFGPYPGAIQGHAPLPPVAPGRVVGLGAVCDLRPPRPADDAHAQDFSVHEYVVLDDGRSVLLHTDRGFSISQAIARGRYVGFRMTRDEIVQLVLNTVLPDEDDVDEDHPFEWLAELARARGLDVTADALRALPYEVVLTEEVTRWLGST